MDASALKSASEALESAARSLESRSDALEKWLLFWIILVVIGVVLELAVVITAYRHELSEFRRAVISTPDNPSIRMFVFEIFGAGLVAIGVAGEFGINVSSRTVETELRDKKSQLVALSQVAAGEAVERAFKNEKEAAELKRKNLERQIEILSLRSRTARAEKEAAEDKLAFIRLQSPRQLTGEQQSRFREEAAKFKGTPFVVKGVAGDSDSVSLASLLINLLSDPRDGAGWVRQKAIIEPGQISVTLKQADSAIVPVITETGVRFAGGPGQWKPLDFLGKRLAEAGIFSTGLGGGSADEFVPVERQAPLIIFVGRKLDLMFKNTR